MNLTRTHFDVEGGAASNVTNSIQRSVPSAVRSLTATPGNSSVALRWTAPASNGGAATAGYVIQRSANGSTGWATINEGVPTTTSHTVTGLSNGTRYYFRVLAKNAAGTGASSNVVHQVPRTVPSAPRLGACPGSGRAVLEWTPPASNGAAITRYFRIAAINAAGTGPWSAPVSAVPR